MFGSISFLEMESSKLNNYSTITHGLFDGCVTNFVNIVIIPLLSLSAVTS
jgi:hypothetical protein